jgi:hypothetical protein
LFADLARTLLTEIATRECDPGFTIQVWNWLVELSGRSTEGIDHVFGPNSSLVNRLDLPAVVPQLLRLAVRAEANFRYFYYLRVLESERPAHMAGWDAVPLAELAAVRADAVRPTGMKGRFSTIELHWKEAGWDVLLCRGEPSALPPFEVALAGEGGYVAHRFLELAACLRLDPLPRAVGALIARSSGDETWDEHERLAAQIGAIEAAHGAGTREAFDSLLGYRQIGEGVLVNLVAALAETARLVMGSGDRSPVEQLFLIAESSPREDGRGAAAAAVAALLEEGSLTPSETVRAAALLPLPATDPYARSDLLIAFAARPTADVPPAAIEFANRALNSPAVQGKRDPRPAALAVLASRPGAHSDPDFLARHLGLMEQGGSLVAGPPTLWGVAPHVVGRYFVAEPERFAPAVASLLREGGASVLAHLLPSLREAKSRIPRVVVDAIVARLRKADSGRVAEPPLLHTLAAIAPDRLLTEGCPNIAAWLPQARADLADTVGELGALPEKLATARFQLLSRLAGDGIYAVRRSAYRAAMKCDSDRFIGLVLSWARWREPGRQGPRRYAAECVGWLPSTVAVEHLAELGWDQEPGVREAYQRSLRERKDRLAAAEFEAPVLKVSDPVGVARNWRYGIGVSRVGDDSTIRRLADRLGDGLPPSVRFWLKRVRKAVERRWGEVTRKWPEPWFARPGHLESFSGVLKGDDGKETVLAGTLWLLPAESPGGRSSWGGWATSEKWWRGDGELIIPDRRPAQILVSSTLLPASELLFWGNGPYPDPAGP